MRSEPGWERNVEASTRVRQRQDGYYGGLGRMSRGGY